MLRIKTNTQTITKNISQEKAKYFYFPKNVLVTNAHQVLCDLRAVFLVRHNALSMQERVFP